ncbi:hypothetical protein ACN26Y_29915 [Micromonospora sp. WMMD558]|uniref:hypothetical protein n=1 Tax=Micromonospora sp. WMMD558 TaxID=3403462 RepID=UPI003BF6073F
MSVSPQMINVFQSMPAWPDEGVIDPFRPYELAAVDKYNSTVLGIDDSLFEFNAVTLTNAAEAGMDPVAYGRDVVALLRQWATALDVLDADLRDDSGRLYNAAVRLLQYEADRLIETTNQVHRAIVRHLLGSAGPVPTDGYLRTSNGHIQLTANAAG